MLDLSEGRPGCQCNGLLPRARLHPRPHAASAFPALHARALGAQLSAGRAADAAAKPAAAQSSLLCTRSGRPTRSPASPGYALPHALLCAPPMPPAALAPPAPSRPRAALRRRGRRYGRRPALSVACRSLAQMLRLVAEDVAASWSAPCQSCHVPQPGKLPARASWWVLVQVLGGFAAGDLVCTAACAVACWPCSGRVECRSVLSVCWCGRR